MTEPSRRVEVMLGGKFRPGIVLRILPGGMLQVVGLTSTHRPEHSPYLIAAASQAGKALHLSGDSYVYKGNVVVVARSDVKQRPPAEKCPPNVFQQVLLHVK